jgi:hypothetical protein
MPISHDDAWNRFLQEEQVKRQKDPDTPRTQFSDDDRQVIVIENQRGNDGRHYSRYLCNSSNCHRILSRSPFVWNTGVRKMKNVSVFHVYLEHILTHILDSPKDSTSKFRP